MLTANRLIELLSYNKETGIFTWNKDMGNATKKGYIANYKRCGYISIRIDGKNYSAHRLAWLHFYGYMPSQNLIPLQGKVIKAQCLWQFDVDEKYPLEFALDPLEKIDGLSWLSSGDVKILRRLK